MCTRFRMLTFAVILFLIQLFSSTPLGPISKVKRSGLASSRHGMYNHFEINVLRAGSLFFSLINLLDEH